MMDIRFILIFAILFNIINLCTSENVKKSLDDNDNGDVGDENNNESLEIQAEPDSAKPDVLNAAKRCSARRDNSLVHETRQAQVKQFPFMAALFSQQNDYVCAGAIIANGLILTTASCLTPSPSYVVINALKDKKDNASVTLHITKTEKFPTYQGGESDKNVGVVYTEKHNASVGARITLSNYTVARNVVEFIALGYGLNTEPNQPKELQYVGLENRRQAVDSTDAIIGIIDCVEIKVLTCFKDFGGPAIFDDQLIGVITKGQETCTSEMSSKFAVNKNMVTVLPVYSFKNWIDQKIQAVDEAQGPEIPVFPEKPSPNFKPKNTRRSGGGGGGGELKHVEARSHATNSTHTYIYLITSTCVALYTYLMKKM